jgi:hypothetical protein
MSASNAAGGNLSALRTSLQWRAASSASSRQSCGTRSRSQNASSNFSSVYIVSTAKRSARPRPCAATASSAASLRAPAAPCGDRSQLRQYGRQRAAFGEHLEHARWPLLHQSARQLLPHALGDQRIGLAVNDHVAHLLERGGRDSETKPRGKPRHAQDAHRVFRKGRADVAQDARFQIGRAAEGIDQIAGVVARDRIDREIAAREVVFERDVGRGMKLEAVVTARGLAFGARERVFLFRCRMQKYREIPADRLIAQLDHFRGGGADHHVIAIGHRQTEQFVAHGTADGVDLHALKPAARIGAAPRSRPQRPRTTPAWQATRAAGPHTAATPRTARPHTS